MDKKTLYRLFVLPKMAEQKRREIQRIREWLTATSPALTGMPHPSGVRDKIGDGVVEMVAKMEELEELCRGYQTEADEINAWIDGIKDLQVQLVVSLRFRERMNWREVADKVGGMNTDDSCRKMVDRYLEKENVEE